MSTFTLKVAACLFMLVDHAAVLAPPAVQLPMHWVGRLAFPLFAFLCAQACEHTGDLMRYVLRLYAASVAMSVVELLLNRTGNAFTTLFHIALIVALLSLRKPVHRAIGIAAYVGWQVVSYVALALAAPGLSALGPVPSAIIGRILITVLGSAASIEGGYLYVLLGVALWLCRSSKRRLAVVYVACCAAFFVLYNCVGAYTGNTLMYFAGLLYTGWAPLTVNYQWMMIAALPLMLAYDGSRGRPVKWLFYWFYPAHLAVIAVAMGLLGLQYGV